MGTSLAGLFSLLLNLVKPILSSKLSLRSRINMRKTTNKSFNITPGYIILFNKFFGSCALPGKMLLVKIIENNNNEAYLRTG